MIRYPNDVKAEMDAAAAQFCQSEIAARLPQDQDIWSAALNNYVYDHCSERTRAFLDDVQVIQAYADKHGLKV